MLILAEYVDVTLIDCMDEPAEVSIRVDNQTPRPGQMTVIKDEEEGDGWVTTWRVQLH